MNIEIGLSELLKHLSFWHNKTDDECIELATNENGVDSEEALKNMLERDFCTEMNNNNSEDLIKESKKNNMDKDNKNTYNKIDISDVSDSNIYLVYFNGDGSERESCLVFGSKVVIANNEVEALDKFITRLSLHGSESEYEVMKIDLIK